MNLICSIFLTFFVVFRPLIPLVDYAVNYHYISQELCENRDKPDLHCNGKCYLAKELSTAIDTGSSPLHKTKTPVQKVLDIFLPAEITEVIAIKITSITQFQINSETDYSFLFLTFIFRPPLF